MRAIIVGEHKLTNVLSASGMEYDGEYYYVVGDDSPDLYVLNKNFEVVKTPRLFVSDVKTNERIPKKQKPDAEAMTFAEWNGKKQLLIFGSGSKKLREKLFVVATDAFAVSEYNLSQFYTLLRESGNINEDDFNLEAAAAIGNKLFLFNRGTNSLFIISENDVEDFLIGGKKPSVIHQSFSLPVVDGVTAGFSGASSFENTLFFSASLERTTNWIDDGEILGSYVGVLDLGSKNTSVQTVAVTKKGVVVPVKIEALVVTGKKENTYTLAAVTDEDNGQSCLLEIELML